MPSTAYCSSTLPSNLHFSAITKKPVVSIVFMRYNDCILRSIS
jgi:hypothetical protein